MRPTPRRLALALALSAAIAAAQANDTPQTLPFSQDWTNTGQITTNHDWSGVPGIIGFRGDGLAGGTGADPQTILARVSPGGATASPNQPRSF